MEEINMDLAAEIRRHIFCALTLELAVLALSAASIRTRCLR
jgi:hypothetical protein